MKIALTGGVGCGKSTALKMLHELGWKVIDADQICHEIYEKEPELLMDLFGDRWGTENVLSVDGEIDRKKIAQIVFEDEVELQWLNSVFHPLIMDRAEKKIGNENEVIFDVPLLFEAEWDKHFDVVVSIWTNKEIQFSRLVERGWNQKEITRRLESQLSSDKKLELADYGLINSGNIKHLNKQIESLDIKLRSQINGC